VLRLVDLQGAPRLKIFGLGLSKTGTSSLCEALRILGYRAAHNPADDESMLALLSGSLRCRATEENDAVCDIMFSRHFRELDRLYSHSVFILTERDRESWHASCARHWMAVGTPCGGTHVAESRQAGRSPGNAVEARRARRIIAGCNSALEWISRQPVPNAS
jgi:Sulfotransferase domain